MNLFLFLNGIIYGVSEQTYVYLMETNELYCMSPPIQIKNIIYLDLQEPFMNLDTRVY